MLAELGAELSLDLLEVKGFKACAGTTVDSRLVPNDVAAERLGESSHRLAKVALEELNNRGGEVEFLSPSNDVLLGQLVGCHPLCEVTNNLRRRRDLQGWCQYGVRHSGDVWDLNDVAALKHRYELFRR